MGGSSSGSDGLYLGIFEGHFDPAVAAVRGGKVIAFSEEERHLRYKHAPHVYPERALRYCLEVAGATMEDVDGVGVNWDLDAYTDGRMKAWFDGMGRDWSLDSGTTSWQQGMLRKFDRERYRDHHVRHWRRMFGDIRFPPLRPFPHHFVHALQAGLQSGFSESIVITIDGSGDHNCTVVWRQEGTALERIREINMPHSLGWVYAAFTEYLGFRAYDGEYKVMGLAAYGRENLELRQRVERVLHEAGDGVGYEVDPAFIHYGEHNYSERFTDAMVELFGRPPRLSSETLTSWHEDLSYEVQRSLEVSVRRLVQWAVTETGLTHVCLGGGVALNVKMNSSVFGMAEVEDVFAHPLCSDGGAAAGAALAASFAESGSVPERLETLALGFEDDLGSVEDMLRLAQLEYERPADICDATAAELAAGRIVGWFQGRMEAGPRALGQRSILADPRAVANRDKVNAIIKFREYWRPFCPSMLHEAAGQYFDEFTDAPFMIISFPANERLSKDAPAIVHVDGTSRVQLVKREILPRYHGLIKAFAERTGVPVLLNTSFNVKGEPIVCTASDALRTFWSTGLDVLVLGDYLLRKPTLSAP